MNADKRRLDLDLVTRRVVGAAFTVANQLGVGFLEKVYENALAHEIRKAGLQVEQQRTVQVFYDGVAVGDYSPDLLVEAAVIVELKVAKALEPVHFAQGMNYLRATKLRVCLLINFGSPKVQIKRLVNKY